MDLKHEDAVKLAVNARKRYVRRRLKILDDMGVVRPDQLLMSRLLDIAVSEVSVDNLIRSYIDSHIEV